MTSPPFIYFFLLLVSLLFSNASSSNDILHHHDDLSLNVEQEQVASHDNLKFYAYDSKDDASIEDILLDQATATTTTTTTTPTTTPFSFFSHYALPRLHLNPNKSFRILNSCFSAIKLGFCNIRNRKCAAAEFGCFLDYLEAFIIKEGASVSFKKADILSIFQDIHDFLEIPTVRNIPEISDMKTKFYAQLYPFVLGRALNFSLLQLSEEANYKINFSSLTLSNSDLVLNSVWRAFLEGFLTPSESDEISNGLQRTATFNRNSRLIETTFSPYSSHLKPQKSIFLELINFIKFGSKLDLERGRELFDSFQGVPKFALNPLLLAWSDRATSILSSESEAGSEAEAEEVCFLNETIQCIFSNHSDPINRSSLIDLVKGIDGMSYFLARAFTSHRILPGLDEFLNHFLTDLKSPRDNELILSMCSFKFSASLCSTKFAHFICNMNPLSISKQLSNFHFVHNLHTAGLIVPVIIPALYKLNSDLGLDRDLFMFLTHPTILLNYSDEPTFRNLLHLCDPGAVFVTFFFSVNEYSDDARGPFKCNLNYTTLPLLLKAMNVYPFDTSFHFFDLFEDTSNIHFGPLHKILSKSKRFFPKWIRELVKTDRESDDPFRSRYFLLYEFVRRNHPDLYNAFPQSIRSRLEQFSAILTEVSIQ